MIKVLEIVGIALVVLTVYYLVCTRFVRLGHSQSFIMIFLSRVLVVLQWACEKVSGFLAGLFERSLNFPPGIDRSEVFLGLAVLARLVYLTIALVIFGGDLSLTESAQASLWQTVATVQLGGVTELASAALFLSISALWGSVLLEILKLIPTSCSLLVPIKHKWLRIIVGVVAGLFTIESIVTIGFFYWWRSIYLLNPDVAAQYTPYILLGLGISTAAASVLCLWALCLGLCGLFSVLVWSLEKGFAALAMALSLIPSILDVVSEHLSSGARSTYEGYLPPDPWKTPTVWFGQSPSYVASDTSPVDDGEITQPVQPKLLPEPKKVSIDTMKNPYKTAAIVFVHTFGSRLFFVVKTAIELLGAAESILDTGLCDLSVSHINAAIPAIIDDSPTNEEKKQAIVHTGTQEAAYETLTGRLAAKLVEVHLQTKAAPAPLVFVIDKQCLSTCVHMLQGIKRRLPLHSIVVMTSFVQADLLEGKIQQGLKAMEALYRDEVLEKVIVLDARSPIALSRGEETQLTFAAHACVSLLLTHKHNLNNTSGNELLKLVRPGGAFASFAFASEILALGKVPSPLSFLPGVRDKVGYGEIGDILLQSQAAIKRCVQDKNCLAFPASIDSSLPAFVLVDIPVKVADSRFAEVVSATSRFVNTTFPFATSAVVSGNGCTYPTEVSSRFHVQASLLFGLPSLLPDETEELEDDTKVFTLVPLPTVENEKPVASSRNGNGHKSRVTVARKSSRTRKSANGN